MPIANIPTIDISPLFGSNSEEKSAVAKKIDDACRNTGFFFAKNHGLKFLDEFFKIVDHFHQNITNDEKWKMAIAAYNPENTEHVLTGFYLPKKDVKTVQSFYIQNPNFNDSHPLIEDKTPLHEINVWPNPSKYPRFREMVEKFYWGGFKLSQALLRGFALALHKEENFFEPFFKSEDTMSSVRLIRYPFIEPYPPGAIKTATDGTLLSFESHLDVSLLTVLYQPHVANLQVQTPDGYQDIEASDDCFLVNGGKFLELISNGYFKAPLHRVKYVNSERLSLPFFVHLAFNSNVEASSPLDENDNQRKTYQYGTFFQNERLELIRKNGQT